MEIFPETAVAEDPIPQAIWPDLRGVIEAPIHTWEPHLSHWELFWTQACQYPMVSVDAETTGLRAFHGDRVVGVSAAFWDGSVIQAGYWNFRHEGHVPHRRCPSESVTAAHVSVCLKCQADTMDGGCPGYQEQAPVMPLDSLQLVRPAFRNCIIAGQNLKFDLNMLSRDGVPHPERTVDTKLIAHLWDENRRGKGSYSLDTLAKEMGQLKLGDTVNQYMAEHGLTLERGHAQVPHYVESPYAVMDTVLVLRRLQWERDRWLRENDRRLIEVFQIENACTPAFAAMEQAGMKLDMDYVRAGCESLQATLDALGARITELNGGQVFDILSPQQLWVVMESRGHKPLDHTPGGMPSTGANEMEAYGETDELARLVLENQC